MISRRQSLVQRLSPRVDKIRQKFTTIGLRPYDVFLVWTRWDGEERGEGYESELRRVAILPRPKVEDLTSLSLSPFSGGVLPVGSVRLSELTAQLTADNLTGRTIPSQAYFDGCGIVMGPGQGTPAGIGLTPGQQIGHSPPRYTDRIPQPNEFFYEIVEDVSGTQATAPATRQKFRLFSVPFKRPGKFDWTVMLERISEDRDRFGKSQFGPDSEP